MRIFFPNGAGNALSEVRYQISFNADEEHHVGICWDSAAVGDKRMFFFDGVRQTPDSGYSETNSIYGSQLTNKILYIGNCITDLGQTRAIQGAISNFGISSDCISDFSDDINNNGLTYLIGG